MFTSKYFYITLSIGFLLGVLPSIMTVLTYGLHLRVPIEIVDDTLFYYSRVSEVLSGHYLIGNSYLLEHVGSITPAFFVADIIYTIPFFFFSLWGSTFTAGIVFSNILWVMFTALLLYILYTKISIPERYIPLAVAVSLVMVYMFLIRPVVMAVVYPSFILFLIALYVWILKPNGKKENIFLVCATALGFYIYTYLWQITLVVFGLLFIRSCITKENRLRIVYMFSSVLFLSLPVIFYTIKQLSNQFYFETLKRTGLIETHTIGGAAILYSVIVLICLGIVYVLWRKKSISEKDTLFFVVVFTSLFIAGLSNVISGKDMEVAVHIARFTDLCVVIFFTYICSIYFSHTDLHHKKYVIVPIIICLYCANTIYTNQKGFFAVFSSRQDVEKYSAVLSEIDHLSQKPSVVLADDNVSSYIPILTKDYVVFHPKALLYLVSDKEIEERYLVSRMFQNLTIEQIKSDYRKYAGVGNAIHEANVINRKTKICEIAKKILPMLPCQRKINPYGLRGDLYFAELLKSYNYIRSHREQFLDKYHVGYVIINQPNTSGSNRVPREYIPVWSTSDFAIFNRVNKQIKN